MNPDTATLRSTDLCALLGVSNQSIYRWFSAPYPLHHVGSTAPRGKTYAIPEVVARLRARRGGGLTGDDLSAIVAFDSATRSDRSDDFLWLGSFPELRAREFKECLEPEEYERLRSVEKEIRNSAIAVGLSDIDRLSKTTAIFPAVVRFVLSGDPSELPANEAGWKSLCKSLWAVNPPEINIEEAA